MLRALLDSGCSQTIILKKFTNRKNRRLLAEKDKIKYTTYGGYFTSDSVAAIISFKIIEFNTYKEKLINYQFQVDSVQQRKNTTYDIIIGPNLMDDLGIDLNYSDNSIVIKSDGIVNKIPMKTLGATQNIETCNLIYNIHVDSLILQKEEKRQGKLLDANYTKVDINDMVKALDIPKESKRKLTEKLKKFFTLFGGGLGTLSRHGTNQY